MPRDQQEEGDYIRKGFLGMYVKRVGVLHGLPAFTDVETSSGLLDDCEDSGNARLSGKHLLGLLGTVLTSKATIHAENQLNIS